MPYAQSKMQLLEQLDSGRYGRVYRGTYNGRSCAVKVLPKHRHDVSYHRNRKMIQLEKTHWQIVTGGPGILPLLGTQDDEADVYLASELCAHGSLMSDVKKGRMPERRVSRVMRDVLRAVEWCHRHDVYHGDVKPGNILRADDGTYKLCDFGCSQHAPYATYGCTTRLGTPCYVAPEVFVCADYGFVADVWSVGATAYVLLTGGECPSKKDILVPDLVSEEAQDFLRRAMEMDRYKRPMARDLLGHPFLRVRSDRESENLCCSQENGNVAAAEPCSYV
jgi:serine/threonine protein kinase